MVFYDSPCQPVIRPLTAEFIHVWELSWLRSWKYQMRMLFLHQAEVARDQVFSSCCRFERRYSSRSNLNLEYWIPNDAHYCRTTPTKVRMCLRLNHIEANAFSKRKCGKPMCTKNSRSGGSTFLIFALFWFQTRPTFVPVQPEVFWLTTYLA